MTAGILLGNQLNFGYYLVCYNRERKTLHNCKDYAGFFFQKRKENLVLQALKLSFKKNEITFTITREIDINNL